MCVCVCVCVRACVRACVHGACVHVRACVLTCLRVCVIFVCLMAVDYMLACDVQRQQEWASVVPAEVAASCTETRQQGHRRSLYGQQSAVLQHQGLTYCKASRHCQCSVAAGWMTGIAFCLYLFFECCCLE